MVNIKPPELDAQYAVLGAVLIDPSIAGEVVQAVHPDDFTDATCKNVFAAIRELYISGARLDAVTVLHQLGSPAYRQYLAQLMDITPTAAGWKNYAGIMHDQAQLYRMRELAVQLEASATLADAQAIITKLYDSQADKSRRAYSVSDGFRVFIDAQERQPEYLEFGFEPLDDGKLFAARGDFIVIGARPSVGKTALAIQMARHMGQTYNVGFFSLETDARKFFDRYVANRSGVQFGRIKRHELDEEDYPQISADMHSDMQGVKLTMVEASGMSVDDIRAMTMARRFDVIFVDYLQLISGTGRDSYQRVTQISMGLHNLAQQCNVAVIALAQLRREERSTNRKTQKTTVAAPTLADLRESGQIEQDADVVMLMYLSDPDNPYSARILRVAKNKEGERGKVRLAFDGSRQRFAYVPSEEPPKIGQPQPVPKKTTMEQMNMFPMQRGEIC